VRLPHQTKHVKKWKQLKATLETESNVLLPAESDQGPVLPKAVEWVGQTKEARPQALVAVLWRQIVVAMKKKKKKKIQNHLQ
jgi:hypothetical protein